MGRTAGLQYRRRGFYGGQAVIPNSKQTTDDTDQQIAVLRSGRVSAFTFFSIKIPLKAACFEERIYRKVEEVEEIEEVEEKEKKEKNHNEPPVRLRGRNGLF
ncbi:MAG: hypothetical protein LBK08_10515 [Treponema sp.]|jgi:hypothetical protein|nr:hypothetical protein [Treponema sp.]